MAMMHSDLDHVDYSSDSDTEQTKDDNAKATPDTSSTPLEPHEVGMTVGLKQLYSGKEDKRGRFQWQTEIPKDVGKPAEDAESEKWALVVRHVKVYNDPKRVLAIHSIVVQSPLIKELLEDVLDDYPGVAVGLKRLEFSDRFKPLIHRWPALRDAISSMEKQLAEEEMIDAVLANKLEHAKLLEEVLVKEFTDIAESMDDMKKNGVITYDHLWTIFQPNSLIYAKQDNQDRAVRLQSTKYGVDSQNNPCFWVSGVYIDFDGTRFGTQKINIKVSPFEGTIPIKSLQAFPMDFHEDAAGMKAKLIERGDKIEKLAGTHFRNYNGVGWRYNSYGTKDKTTVKGRIVIDTFGFNRFNPDHAVYVTPLTATAAHDAKRATRLARRAQRGHSGGDHYGHPFGGGYATDPGLILDLDDGGMPSDGFFDDEADDSSKRQPLDDDQKMICSPLVRGFALREKIWLNLFVNAVSDVTFNDKAFEALNLPNKQKELIMGFTSSKQAYRSSFDDVIAGKGRGIIILLSGPPGVGKTLTAESVAEQLKVPLFVMAAGDLGVDPRSVETKLQGVLDMCQRWNALLLLDEADVFLEQRSMHDLERNKLVSIFLRVLEYYEGTMFLTTNRVETFDAAFQSRIHISLEYGELDYKTRKGIWETFLAQHNAAQASARTKPAKAFSVGMVRNQDAENAAVDGVDDEATAALHAKLTLPHALDEKDLRKLAQLKLNGRQIKNFLKTAQLLANHQELPLKYEHVAQVAEVTQHLHNATMATEGAKAAIFN